MKRKISKLLSITLCCILSLTVSFACSSTAFATELLDSKTVLVSGKAIGIVMTTDGVIITKVTSVTGNDGEKHYPAADAGLRAGDVIKKINGVKAENSNIISRLINETNTKTFELVYERNGEEMKTEITPEVDTENGERKLGILARDATSGIGTLTFIDPEMKAFASLGHPISEQNTGVILPVKSGEITLADITGVIKGKSGEPGELQGKFGLTDIIGQIKKNNEFGLFGVIDDDDVMKSGILLPVAEQSEIKVGKAEILCTVDSGEPEYYEIKITRVNSQSEKESKGMTIEVTDERLISKTGGIVQGMSGSPIIQNGKLVGAVTHVTVNNPTKGYGIFIEWMLDECKDLAS